MGNTARKRSSSTSIELDCDPSVEIGDFVYLGSDEVVKQADASTPLKMPAIGYVLKKKSNGKALLVQFFLEEETEDKIPQKAYFISATRPGKLEDVQPVGKDTVIQRVAVGVTSTTMLIQIVPQLAVIRS